MMDNHPKVLCATMLATLLITSQGQLSLPFPVWAIVAVMATLPAMMILAAMMRIEAFAATVFGRNTRGLCLTIESIAAMLAEKLLGLALPGSQIAGTTTVVPDRIRGANIESEHVAALLADKVNEWVLSVDVSLVPVRVILATVVCPKASGAAILEKWSRAAYLALKGFATMVASKLARETLRGFMCATTFLATVSANWPRTIWLKAESVATMFTGSYCWRLFEAHDSTSGYVLGFDVGAHLPEMVLVGGLQGHPSPINSIGERGKMSNTRKRGEP